MSRVTKKPEERREEILNAAEHLFRARGFESVQVSDIVASLGVAQGTFYYYFPSKDDVMMAILERNWSRFATMASGYAQSLGQDPLSRLVGLMRGFFTPVDSEFAVESYFGDGAGPEVAARFHAKFDEMRLRMFEPVISGLVAEGIQQGVFSPLTHARRIVEVVFMGVSAYMHAHSHEMVSSSSAREAAGAIGELLERILGLPRASIDIFGTEVETR